MKIESVKLSLPSRVVTNQMILDFIREYSSALPQEKLKNILSRVKAYLRISGSKERYWREENESPIALLKKAYTSAMEEAGWKNDDVDLLIYVGVGRGFLEPGGAYTVAQSLGLTKVICFDILDACMSWARAVEVIYHYFQLGKYKKAVIVNAEFNIHEYSFPELYNIKDESMLEYCFPAYTVGEAATVTLLSHEKNQKAEPWEFHFSSRPDLSDLCAIPLPHFKLFADNPSEKLGKNGPMLFTSYGIELHAKGNIEGIKLFRELSIPVENIDIVFTHASSSTAWESAGKVVGIDGKIHHIYPQTGNLVSASIPAAMAMALQENKFKRGDRVVCWVASAGMSFAAFSFVF
ncbi:MAG TPA: 3-oxoacyl-[acyl-carrier-protein] synthase III C-terminal domain-containing protein [Gammaproteobacteria bacterium]|nr:3-oxoacyl-[acyl-carrier-protein] synthase III C-terminal domain-containing protein [Gammaproteobacteria bacterium]